MNHPYGTELNINEWQKQQKRDKKEKINKPYIKMSEGVIRSMASYHYMKSSGLQDVKMSKKLIYVCYCFCFNI